MRAVAGVRFGKPFAALAIWLCLAAPVFALTLPALSGRVVDEARVISADARSAIESKSAELESKSGIQLVVATVGSLEGSAIEPYANALFRAWQLGQRDKNNGVLLLVAPRERQVRIEVGYGLEGTLTDAVSKVIIAGAITPRFKDGDFSGGVLAGVERIVAVLDTEAGGEAGGPQPAEQALPARSAAGDPTNWLVLLGIVGLIGLLIVSPGFRWFFLNLVVQLLLSGLSSSGGGSSRGGGFSGGGGSSGGGGASGSW